MALLELREQFVATEAIRVARRTGGAKELTPRALHVLQTALGARGGGTTSRALSLENADKLIGGTKPSSVNAYADRLVAFWSWCDSNHAEHSPPSAETVTKYLQEVSGRGTTASPIHNFLAAMKFFGDLAGFGDITGDPAIRKLKAAIVRRKGNRKSPKAPLFSFDLAASPLAGSPDPRDIALHTAMLVMLEAACRWDDLRSVTLGDLRFFAQSQTLPRRVAMILVGTKTDRDCRGQETSFPWTEEAGRACTRILSMVSAGARRLAEAPGELRTDLTTAFLVTIGDRAVPEGDRVLREAVSPLLSIQCPGGKAFPWEHLPLFGAWVSARELTAKTGLGEPLCYKGLLRAVKAAGAAVGLDPRVVGTHSLRRGATVELEHAGASHRELMLSLRHRVPSSTETYRMPAAAACSIAGLREEASRELGR